MSSEPSLTIEPNLASENPVERATALAGMTDSHALRGRGHPLGAVQVVNPKGLPNYIASLEDPHPFVRAVALGCLGASCSSQTALDKNLLRNALTQVLDLVIDAAQIEVPQGFNTQSYHGMYLFSADGKPDYDSVGKVAMEVAETLLTRLDRDEVYAHALSSEVLRRDANPTVVTETLAKVDLTHQLMLFQLGQGEGSRAGLARKLFEDHMAVAPLALPLLLILKYEHDEPLVAAAVARAEALVEAGECGLAKDPVRLGDPWPVSRLLKFDPNTATPEEGTAFVEGARFMLGSSLSSARHLLVLYGLDAIPNGLPLLRLVNERDEQLSEKQRAVSRVLVAAPVDAGLRRCTEHPVPVAAGSGSRCRQAAKGG